MRRAALLVPVLLLLPACGSDDQPGSASGRSGGAAAIEGLEVAPEDPSHEHSEQRQTYDADPPFGGPHFPQWLACDVYDEPVPVELAVHSLEHGAVWLAHRPDLPQEAVDQLAALAEQDEEYVLVSPYPGLPSPVVAATWGRQLAVEQATDPRLEQFVEVFAGGDSGGEPGAPCRGGGLTPREAEGVLTAGQRQRPVTDDAPTVVAADRGRR